jgi:hypothetical protein
MDIALHQFTESTVNKAVSLQGRFAGKSASNNEYMEVTLAVSCARMACMQMAVIPDFEMFGGKSFAQEAFYCLYALFAHCRVSLG